MSGTAPDKNREERIDMEVVVDAYNEDERAMGCRANASKIKLGAAMPHQRDCAIAKNTSESYRRYFLNSVGIINNYFYSL